MVLYFVGFKETPAICIVGFFSKKCFCPEPLEQSAVLAGGGQSLCERSVPDSYCHNGKMWKYKNTKLAQGKYKQARSFEINASLEKLQALN